MSASVPYIRIEVENPTDKGFGGYSDIQWEKVKSLPKEAGYLYVDYRTGTPTIPEETIEICNIRKPGSIVAHWLQVQADRRGSAVAIALQTGFSPYEELGPASFESRPK